MKAVVLYESVYGNSATVAGAIADGLDSVEEVKLARFGELPQGARGGGGPGGSGRTDPRLGHDQGRVPQEEPNAEGYTVGAREWLEGSQASGKWPRRSIRGSGSRGG
jgi:hypothetical protein